MDISNWIAAISSIASVVSACAAFRSAGLAKQTIGENRKIAEFAQGVSLTALESNDSASKTAQNMFKRQYIFELHKAWDGICDVSKKSSAEDALKGVSILNLTAAVWLHDVMDKKILHQTYSRDYIDLYNSLYSINSSWPSMAKTGRDLLTDAVTRVFNEMKSRNDNQVQASTISS